MHSVQGPLEVIYHIFASCPRCVFREQRKKKKQNIQNTNTLLLEAELMHLTTNAVTGHEKG